MSQSILTITSSDSKRQLWREKVKDFHLFRASLARKLNCLEYALFVESTVNNKTRSQRISPLKVNDPTAKGFVIQMNNLLREINQPLQIPNSVEKEMEDLVKKNPTLGVIFFHPDSEGEWSVKECKQVKEILTNLVWDYQTDDGKRARKLIEGLNYCIKYNLKALFTA